MFIVQFLKDFAYGSYIFNLKKGEWMSYAGSRFFLTWLFSVSLLLIVTCLSYLRLIPVDKDSYILQVFGVSLILALIIPPSKKEMDNKYKEKDIIYNSKALKYFGSVYLVLLVLFLISIFVNNDKCKHHSPIEKNIHYNTPPPPKEKEKE